MVKSNTSYYRYIYCFFFVFIGQISPVLSQGNCLIYAEDSDERIACELSYRAIEYRQGSKMSQLLFDQAIKIGPKYAWAYYEKSVPFFKRGLFAEGVRLINKAIELEPQNYLYYRAYWYFYNRSYEYCIKDLEALYTTHKESYCTTPSSELEMRLLLAMAYAQTGQISKGIAWVQNLMDSYQAKPHLKGYYDHYCLGILYFQNKQYDLAEAEFKKQLKVNGLFADTYYYLGLIQQKASNPTLAKNYFEQALVKMSGEQDGHSVNFFVEYNIDKSDVEKVLGS